MQNNWIQDTKLEIAKVARDFSVGEDKDSLKIFALSLTLLPPQVEDENEDEDEDDGNTFGYITVFDLGRGGGKSKKTGNIVVNFEKSISTGLVAATGALAATQMIPVSLVTGLIGLLGLCLRFQALEKIQLDGEHAVVVYALFRHGNQKKQITEVAALTVATQFFNFQGFPPLNKQRFDNILNNLKRMRIIKTDGVTITLNEEVRLAA